MQLGEEEKAASAIDQYIEDADDEEFAANMQLRKGEMYFNTGKYEDAIAEYQKIIDKFPDTQTVGDAYFWLGWSYYKLNKLTQAEEYFQYMWENYPNHALADEAFFRYGFIQYEKKVYEEAIDVFDQLPEKYPKTTFLAESSYYLAKCYQKLNNLALAKRNFLYTTQNFAKSEPAYRAHLELGKIYLNDREYSNALAHFKTVADERNDELGAEAQFNIGNVYFEQDDYEKAGLEYLRIKYQYEAYTQWAIEAEFMVARCYKKSDNWVEAKRIYQKIIERNRDNEYGERARKLLEQGKD
jgi:TolA-binding protein